jgi:catechol-2,3-dioxygenase
VRRGGIGLHRRCLLSHHEWMRGRSRTDWWGVVLEAPDGVGLANFYANLLGWPVAKQDEYGAAIGVPGTSSYLAFQSSPDYVPPVWPAAEGRQQMMMHIDVAVDDLAAAVTGAVELGATVAVYQPQEDVRVLLDPAGHPFCLYLEHGLD